MKRIILIVLLFACGIAGQFVLKARRPVDTPLMADSAIAALGGFRSLAVEAIWFRADLLQSEGRFVELAQLASTLTFLEPHTPEVWSYAAWNLAYNVSVMMPTMEDRWRWVQASLHLLRDRGLPLNPREAELYREIAWFFQLKLGADLDSASGLYRAKWRAIVEDVARRNAWNELAMDPMRMAAVELQYGVYDWADPISSALYWAHQGLPYAQGQDRAFLNELIRQSRVVLSKRPSPVR